MRKTEIQIIKLSLIQKSSTRHCRLPFSFDCANVQIWSELAPMLALMEKKNITVRKAALDTRIGNEKKK
jgi:hypothetical protein